MPSPSFRSWLTRLRSPRRNPVRRPSKVRLAVERCEDRTVPSTSIPLNATTWTGIGPSPISLGQGPGNAASTGRINGIAVDPTNATTMYVASDSGGIWKSTDGGKTWAPRTDQIAMQFQTIAMIHRTGGNTVYSFDQAGNLWTSTDGATTFKKTSPFPVDAVVNKLIVTATNPADQTKDVLFAAVGSIFGVPPGGLPAGSPGMTPGSGIWRSTDGGATWTNIVDSTKSPFTTNPANPIPANSLSFSDVVVNPADPNTVYAAVGNASGDPINGVYRTTNALAATPTWTLLLGGSSFVPGETPGNIKLAISPVVTSELFASLTLRIDPQSGFEAPMLGVFRTTDKGVNWTPVLLPSNPNNPIGDAFNFMGDYGYDNSVVMVSPTSPNNSAQQIVYLAGYGKNGGSNTVLASTNSGGTWTQVGIGSNGVGTYPNVHAGGFDNQGRPVFATGGGVFRLDGLKPVTWESLNGNAGPGGLNVVDVNGLAVNPTDANQALANVSYAGGVFNQTVGQMTNVGPALHGAIQFIDPGAGGFGGPGAAYGWQSVDSFTVDNNVGTGQVVYNPFNPNIIYRVVADDGFTNNFIRVSTDGGVSWTSATMGFEADPFVPALPSPLAVGLGDFFNTPPLAIDPSQPNRLFSGFINVQVTDTNASKWSNKMVFGAAGATNTIPDMPTAAFGIPITAIGVGRESGNANGQGFNGVSLFVGTADGGAGPDLWMNLIPTNAAFPPAGLTWDSTSWAQITPTDPMTGADLFTGSVTQVVVDPANNNTFYVFTSTGQVFRASNFQFKYVVVGTNVVGQASADWTDLTSNLPAGTFPIARPQGLALDSQVLSDPNDDQLYAATPSQGVWRLNNPAGDFSTTQPVWEQVGLDPANGNAPTLPIAPITSLSLNTTTGILAAGTYGRGVFELQVRGLITGHVFTDTNGNGLRDAGEPPQAGVTVEILDQNNGGLVVAATSTDATGFYEFRSLQPGNYTLVAIGPGGQIQTTGLPSNLATFTEASQDTIDVGLFKPGSISGTVFDDHNNNGKLDAGETGLGGIQVYIDSNGDDMFESGEPNTFSTLAGAYSFNNLGPAVIGGLPNPVTFNGTYPVREVTPAGFSQTTPALPAVTLQSGQTVTGQAIGNIRTASIAGSVFVDTNGNASFDTGEPGAGNITVKLNNGSTTVTTLTASDGSYTFSDLAPGTYTVTITVPTGDAQTTPNPDPITLAAVDNRTGITFGVFKAVTISGVAFSDVNQNGTRDTGEAGIAGLTIDLINTSTNAVVATTLSFAGGTFSFANVAPPTTGFYKVAEEPKAGFVQTSAPPPFGLTSGVNVTGLAIGNFATYSITGTAYVDKNGDGIQQPGELGAPGVTIQLVDSTNTVVGQGTSVSTGAFSITNVGPGAFTLKEVPPAGYSVTQGAAGYAIVGKAGVNVSGKNFGNVPLPAISGIAFVDTNGNGVLDAGETGAAGVTVQLTGPGATVTSAVTGTDGSYSFLGLTAGTYSVTEVANAGFVRTTSNPGTITITGPSDPGKTGINFGNFQTMVIAGSAFNDANGNHTQDSGEAGLAGVTIHLVNALNGDVYGVTTTDANGNFLFADVGPIPGGVPYVVVQGALPAHFHRTTAGPTSFPPISGVNPTAVTFGDTFVAPLIATGAGVGGAPLVVVRDAATQAVISSFNAFAANFTGGARVATALFTGTSPYIVVAAGPGGAPDVRVFDLSGNLLSEFFAYDAKFNGGVTVATGDINGDGVPDIITGADAGGGPHVKVFDGAALIGGKVQEDASFFAYGATFTGGVRVAAGDVNGLGYDDIITGAGAGGGPHVEAFDGKSLGLIRSFFAYGASFTGGVYIAAADLNGDGRADIIAGPGLSGGPDLRVFDGLTTSLSKETFPFPAGAGASTWSSGLTVAVTDLNGDGVPDIIVGPGVGQPPNIRVVDGTTFAQLLPGSDLAAFDPAFMGGVFVGGI